MISKKPLVKGYSEAAKLTGIPERQLRRMTYSRRIRVIRPNERLVYFDENQLWEDINSMTQEKRQ